MKITIDAAVVQQALEYNATTGLFMWRVSAFHKRNRGKIAGSKKGNGYVEIQINGRMHKAHRLAWLVSFGELPPDLEIDHIDGDRSNNAIANLRLVTKAVNQQNQRSPHARNKLGYLGVSKNGSGYRAEIKVNGKKKCIGTYSTPEIASTAYINAKRQLHEGCTL
jgi:hypothetical protein